MQPIVRFLWCWISTFGFTEPHIWCACLCVISLGRTHSSLTFLDSLRPSPLSGDNAILLLSGEVGLSLSEGMYRFLLPRSACCYRVRERYIVSQTVHKQQMQNTVYEIKSHLLNVQWWHLNNVCIYTAYPEKISAIPKVWYTEAGY